MTVYSSSQPRRGREARAALVLIAAAMGAAVGARPAAAGMLLVADSMKIQLYDAHTGAVQPGEYIPVGFTGMPSGGSGSSGATTTGTTSSGTTTGGTTTTGTTTTGTTSSGTTTTGTTTTGTTSTGATTTGTTSSGTTSSGTTSGGTTGGGMTSGGGTTGGGMTSGGTGSNGPLFSGLANPTAMAFGPDGNVYVGDNGAATSQVLRFSALDGSFLGVFVPGGSGGLSNPLSLTFGLDGNLYVGDASHQVLRYNGMTGAFIDAFVSAGSGGLQTPRGLTFGPDGNLYVADGLGNQVLRYNGTTGAFIDAVIAPGSGGLQNPRTVLFAPNGNLYVASSSTNQVLRYSSSSGAFVNAIVTAGSGGLSGPSSMQFGPDGNLYVVSTGSNQVLSYNGSTGAFIGIFIPSGALSSPTALAFTPPDAPRMVNISGITPTQISLAWMLNSGDQTGVTVWRKGGGFGWTRIAMLPAMSFSFTDSGLTPGVSYKYRVRSVNQYGISPWADEPSATTTPMVPDTVSTLAAWTAGPGTISVTWQGSGSGLVSSYIVMRKGGGADWSTIATVAGNVNSYVDTGLVGNTQYTYRVRAISPVAISLDWSNEASAWTPIVPPGTPASLAATVASSTQINLTWSLPANSDETAVTVWRKTSTGAFVRIAVLPAHSTSYNDTGLTAGTACTYEVRTANDYFISAFSNQVTATPQ